MIIRPKQLREIFTYKLILLSADTLFSLYTAASVSDLLGRASEGISEVFLFYVLRLSDCQRHYGLLLQKT